MKQPQLSLQAGDKLQLQKTPSDRLERYVVQVVGLMPGKSVIVSTPRINGKVAIIRPDQRYTVRVLQGSSVFGFVSSVLQSYNAPFPHVHLSYPREMESIVVRNSLRAATDLQGLARNLKNPDEKENYRGVRLIDLSNSGARITSAGPLGGEEDVVSLQFSIEVCGMEENLSVVGMIRGLGKRNQEGDPLKFWTGLEFRSLNRYQKVVLQAFVLERFVSTQKR